MNGDAPEAARAEVPCGERKKCSTNSRDGRHRTAGDQLTRFSVSKFHLGLGEPLIQFHVVAIGAPVDEEIGHRLPHRDP